VWDFADHGVTHPGVMNNQPTHLTIVGRSANGLPRTYRRGSLHASRTAAYRRLAAAILSLDVPTLTHELRSRRIYSSTARAA
jgi:hypothetical protein